MPDEVIYISCAQDTLARDIKTLGASGYSLASTGILDMFPRTAYFETVSVLKRN
jgi:23S rRNA (uracil1939-C5)-methyltransferase